MERKSKGGKREVKGREKRRSNGMILVPQLLLCDCVPAFTPRNFPSRTFSLNPNHKPKPNSNVRPPVRPQNISLISLKFGI